MTSTGDHRELVSFVATPEDDLVCIEDELESQELRLTVPDLADVAPTSTDRFRFPVDDAIALTATKLTVAPHSSLHVRDEVGEHLGQPTSTPRRFPSSTYTLDVQGSLKAYVRVVDAAFTATYRSPDLDYAPLDVAFERPTRVEIGARSVHSRPRATITVPDDPAALLEALPYLASSLKERSAERSWPTLRGHPPAIDRGERLHVPDVLTAPDTGVTLEVPATVADAYRVAPLAFYLGADVVPGDRPTLRLDNGHVEPLSTPERSLEETVEELLGRCLLLDSLVRIGGYYSLQRHEYDELAPGLPFYPPNLADRSLSDQLLEYLEVEAAVLAPYRPKWPFVPTLRADPADAELLPFLLDSLAPIRVANGGGTRAPRAMSPLAPPDTATSDAPAAARTANERVAERGLRLHTDTFPNALDRTIPDPDDVRLAFVLADADRAERLRRHVETTRQSRLRAATVDVSTNPTGAALAALLGEGSEAPDALYYEPTEGGAVPDAVVAALAGEGCPPVVAVGGSLAPQDERSLVASGLVAGLSIDQPPSVAELGRVASTLLLGHSLERSAALADLTPGHRLFGRPAAVLVRREHGLPPLEVDVRSRSVDEHHVVRWVPAVEPFPLGSVTRVRNEDPEDVHHLVGTAVTQARVHSTADVVELLSDDDFVVRLNGDPHHGEREATREFVCDSARTALGRTRD